MDFYFFAFLKKSMSGWYWIYGCFLCSADEGKPVSGQRNISSLRNHYYLLLPDGQHIIFTLWKLSSFHHWLLPWQWFVISVKVSFHKRFQHQDYFSFLHFLWDSIRLVNWTFEIFANSFSVGENCFFFFKTF